MYKIGYRAPGDMGEFITTEYNFDTDMGVDISHSVDRDSYIAGFWHEECGLVTYYRAGSVTEIIEELHLIVVNGAD